MGTYTKTTERAFTSVTQTASAVGSAAKADIQLQTVATSTSRWTDQLNGLTRPDYRRVIARGGNATTPMTGYEAKVEQTNAFYHVYGNISSNPANQQEAGLRRFKLSQPLFTGWPIGIDPSATDAKADALALTKANRQLEDILTSFQGGVFLGELREALHMIRNPLHGLRKGVGNYLDALKTRRRGSRQHRTKVVADTWLEYSFGWLPLLHDLNSARNFIEKRFNQLAMELVPFKAVNIQDEPLSEVLNQTGFGVTFKWYLLTRRRAIVVYAGAVNSAAQNPQLITMDALGLSPRSFVPTLWELLPWSFLIDYFTNVGDVITGWANQRTSLSWGRRTKISLVERQSGQQFKPTDHGYGTVYLEQFTPGKLVAHAKNVTRDPISNLGPPPLYFELPGFGLKWLNLAALAATRKRLEPY